ncbi:hypothetical protein SAMN05216223_107257 [Actinacidiphila yanglinensis]|uniref:Uncharacterized protein n=1 Tax=Actinacidiphila yanglinensis TaxID=310779 RepID=A0A1H6BUT0_9ACTN|nr:DUF6303 family protein [Actinacidiphila yanglinensis]SEG64410.1 hypothetical protein SAMN05216223_107257 [Actinacidiphila yanglinensis]
MSADRALISHRDYHWSLIVVLLGIPASQYPEFEWADRAAIPTPAQRRDALTAIGYQAAPGKEWEWTEMYPDPDAPPAPVELIAAIDVHPAGGEGP